KLTALEAVNKMLYLSRNDEKVENQLKIYYAMRTIGLMINYSTTNHSQSEDGEIIRKHLKKYRKEFLNSNVSFIRKIVYLFFMSMPYQSIEGLSRIYKFIKSK